MPRLPAAPRREPAFHSSLFQDHDEAHAATAEVAAPFATHIVPLATPTLNSRSALQTAKARCRLATTLAAERVHAVRRSVSVSPDKLPEMTSSGLRVSRLSTSPSRFLSTSSKRVQGGWTAEVPAPVEHDEDNADALTDHAEPSYTPRQPLESTPRLPKVKKSSQAHSIASNPPTAAPRAGNGTPALHVGGLNFMPSRGTLFGSKNLTQAENPLTQPAVPVLAQNSLVQRDIKSAALKLLSNQTLTLQTFRTSTTRVPRIAP